jgi:hypothetical protein
LALQVIDVLHPGRANVSKVRMFQPKIEMLFSSRIIVSPAELGKPGVF